VSRRTTQILAGALAVAAVLLAVRGFVGTDASLDANAHGIINDDRPGINAHNSPSVAVDPARPEVMAVADRIDTPNISCSLALSENGGVNWRGVTIPLPTGSPNCFWPSVAYAPNGDLILLYSVLDGRYNQPVSVWLQRFTGPVPMGAPKQVAGANSFHARMAVDENRVVVTWVQAGPATAERPIGFAPEPNPLVIATSLDGGRNFTPAVAISEAGRRVVEPSIVLGPDGLVVVTALDLADDTLDYNAEHEGQGGPPADGFWRVLSWTSQDNGTSFTPVAMVAPEVVIPQRIYVDLGAPRPGLARDPNLGRLYATWESGVGRARDAFLATSDDDGRTWSFPRPVVARPGTQTLPTVAVAADGRVDVAFYDRSGDRTDVNTQVALASSWDGGASFTTSIISQRRFDSRIGFGSFQGIPVLGTHLAVVAEEDRSVVFWSDTRRGTIDDSIQDLAVALVDVGAAGRTRWLLVVLALVLAGGAIALALRRPPPARRR